jgi:hypothetical protein
MIPVVINAKQIEVTIKDDIGHLGKKILRRILKNLLFYKTDRKCI